MLTGNILHAHPSDMVGFKFLSDTLEHCPYEALRASAAGWSKEKLITAHRRSSYHTSGSAGASTGASTLANMQIATPGQE